MVPLLDTIPMGSSEFLILEHFGNFWRRLLTFLGPMLIEHRGWKIVFESPRTETILVQSPFDVYKVSIEYTVKTCNGSCHKDADFLLKNCRTTLAS